MSDAETHEPTDWMAGFPPQDDRILRFADSSFLGWPQLKWSFNHIEQLVPHKVGVAGPRSGARARTGTDLARGSGDPAR